MLYCWLGHQLLSSGVLGNGPSSKVMHVCLVCLFAMRRLWRLLCDLHWRKQRKWVLGRAQGSGAFRPLCSWLGGFAVPLVLDNCSSEHSSDIASMFLRLLQEEGEQDEGFLPLLSQRRGRGVASRQESVQSRQCPGREEGWAVWHVVTSGKAITGLLILEIGQPPMLK